MALRVVWLALALACSVAACEKRESAPPSPRVPPPSPRPPSPPPKAPIDTAAPAGAPVQTPLPSPPASLQIDFSKVPDFGCLAWSAARELTACVIGERGSNVGPSKVRLVFIPLGGAAAAPEPLVLLDVQAEHPGPDELPEDIAKLFEASLQGFAPLDRKGPSITLSGDGAPLVQGSPLAAGDMTVELRGNRVPPASIAPQYDTLLTVRGPGGSRHVLHGTTAPISRLEVRAYPLRDRASRSVVIVEQEYGVGDEGIMGSRGAVWRCFAKACQES